MIEPFPNSLTDTTRDSLTLPVPGGVDVLGRILREGAGCRGRSDALGAQATRARD